MSKPWEHDLSVMQFDRERRCLVETTGGARMVAIIRNFDAEDWEPFLVAAPAMARALMGVVARGESLRSSLPGDKTVDDIADMDTTIPIPASVLRDALDALRKAGVPL